MTQAVADDLRGKIKDLDAVLRDQAAPAGERLQAAWDLHEMLCAVVAVTDNGDCAPNTPDLQDTGSPHGVALSPYDAALCLREYLRTAVFAEGVRQAIQSAQAQFPNQRLRVLYAGTGPLATLATLQLGYFAADEVGFTLLDMHERSTAATKVLYSAMGATAYVDDWVTADATTFSPDHRYHVIIAEVMQRALVKEPQVQVTRHLAQFLEPGGHFVPEAVQLDLTLVDPARQFDSQRQSVYEGCVVGQAFELTAQSALALQPKGGYVALGDLSIPQGIGTNPAALAITTTIITFGDQVLRDGDCSLNITCMADVPRTPRVGDQLRYGYRLGTNPGLEFELTAN